MRDLFLKTNLDSLASILQVLQQGSTESKIASARVLETIANDAESKLIIAEKENLIGGITQTNISRKRIICNRSRTVMLDPNLNAETSEIETGPEGSESIECSDRARGDDTVERVLLVP
ncbi:hypothetical protein CMV_020767 [Castanea mollissima]|uniref:Uncharacterized protein n=1 Tax=Castanea mollissima TaxID=60419 RepID=A0A8J4VLA6_9ROSI|nr:hypothetical protein CMV_020767 [Castanea mollissima]